MGGGEAWCWWPDADQAGAVAVLHLVANHGARVRLWPPIAAGDPADWLAAELAEWIGTH